MRIQTITLVGVLGILLTAGCGGKTNSQSSTEPLPWSRVEAVEVTSDTEGQEASSQTTPKVNGQVTVGSSESEVIMAWGMPNYIQDSTEDQNRRIWQYSHALLVFEGTKVEKVLPR